VQPTTIKNNKKHKEPAFICIELFCIKISKSAI